MRSRNRDIKPKIKYPYGADRDVLQHIVSYMGVHQTVFLNGACWQMMVFLKKHYRSAEAWYDPIEGHVYTRIGDFFYDARGAHLDVPNIHKLGDRGSHFRRVISQLRRNAERKLKPLMKY